MRRHLTTRDIGFASAGFLTSALLWKAVFALLILVLVIAPTIFAGSLIVSRLAGRRRDRIIVGPTVFAVLAARWLLSRQR